VPSARLDIAYDGTRFAGWAAQRGMRTVQAEIEGAVEGIVGERVTLTVAGRTDAGVHASGQVASFEHSRVLPDRLAERLNAVLPRDVAITAATAAPDGFDARRDAKGRSYRYRVLTGPLRDPFEEGRALWWRHPLDRSLLDRCAEAVVGTHDLTAFTPTQSEHRLFQRTIHAASWSFTPRVTADPAAPGGRSPRRRAERSVFQEAVGTFEISAPSFMRSQVRVLVGTMLEVGGGRRSLDDFRSLLEGAPRERAGETAPAHGLYLVAVQY